MLDGVETGMYLLFFISMVLYFVALPIIGEVRQRSVPSSPITEEARIKTYIRFITWGLLTTLVVLILCLLLGIRFYDIGLRGIILDQTVWFTAVTLILGGFFFIAHIGCMIAYLVSPKYREGQRESFVPNKTLELLVPRSRTEKRYWLFVSLTAGIGEEIVHRGFLFFILQAAFPNILMPLMLVIASVMFGAAHAYQGLRGMIRSAAFGALLGCLFLVTGSLIPGMVLHVVIDLEAAFNLSEVEIEEQGGVQG